MHILNQEPVNSAVNAVVFQSSGCVDLDVFQVTNPVSFNLKTYRSKAFSVSAPELWNKLPDNIRSCENLSFFKHKLKTYLLLLFHFLSPVLI